MGLFSNESKPAQVDPRVEEAKKLDGSLVVGIGPSGCGKTDTIVRLSLACGFHANEGRGMPWYGYDANGDVAKHMKGIEQFLLAEYKRTGNRATYNRLVYTRKARSEGLFRGPDGLDKMIATVIGWIEKGMEKLEADDPKAYAPKGVLYIDEAGAVRQRDEKFWPTMRMARNAGLTLFSSGHRIKDWHPAALAVIRSVLLWQHPLYDPYDINGITIPRAKCAEAKSNVIKYIVGSDPRVFSWDKSKPGYPAALLVPAQPTKPRFAGF